MKFYTDGGCRGNGRPNAIGSAAAVLQLKDGETSNWVQVLPESPTPTSQRAEITGIMIALKKALDFYNMLKSTPKLNLVIHTDSNYAVGCMRDWIHKWKKNGWINAAGHGVANRDLLEKASQLDAKLSKLGHVQYVWVPREENGVADGLCSQDLRMIERELEDIREWEARQLKLESYKSALPQGQVLYAFGGTRLAS